MKKSDSKMQSFPLIKIAVHCNLIICQNNCFVIDADADDDDDFYHIAQLYDTPPLSSLLIH